MTLAIGIFIYLAVGFFAAFIVAFHDEIDTDDSDTDDVDATSALGGIVLIWPIVLAVTACLFICGLIGALILKCKRLIANQ